MSAIGAYAVLRRSAWPDCVARLYFVGFPPDRTVNSGGKRSSGLF